MQLAPVGPMWYHAFSEAHMPETSRPFFSCASVSPLLQVMGPSQARFSPVLAEAPGWFA